MTTGAIVMMVVCLAGYLGAFLFCASRAAKNK
jgi:hypothetical protein